MTTVITISVQRKFRIFIHLEDFKSLNFVFFFFYKRVAAFSKPQSVGGNSVFEDEVATFKEESTPIEFSTATSLSSLTIDDEVKLPDIVAETYCRSEKTPDADEKNVEKLETDMLNMAVSSPEAQAKEDEQVSDDEDDDDMLAACINMGIQNR